MKEQGEKLPIPFELDTPLEEVPTFLKYLLLRFVHVDAVLDNVKAQEINGIRYGYQYTRKLKEKDVVVFDPYPYPEFPTGVGKIAYSLYEDIEKCGGKKVADSYLNKKKVALLREPVPDAFRKAFTDEGKPAQ